MKNKYLGEKVKELRKRIGFSQERLSEEAQLSLRTIQRIEKGESTPRGDTLTKLTTALGVPPDEIFEAAQTEDKSYLSLLNISALAGVFIQPLFGVVGPFLLWLLKKDRIRLVDNYGKRLLGFQLIWIIIMYAIFHLAAAGVPIQYNFIFFQLLYALGDLRLDINSAYIVISLLLFAYNVLLVIFNYRRIRKGLKSRYFPSIYF